MSKKPNIVTEAKSLLAVHREPGSYSWGELATAVEFQREDDVRRWGNVVVDLFAPREGKSETWDHFRDVLRRCA